MKLINPPETPGSLLAWAVNTQCSRVEIRCIEFVEDIQGEVALPGDWLVELEGIMDVLFRPVGSKRLCVVTRNDGKPAEIIELK